jgi:dihydroflavonol-4-reductase
MKNTSRLIGARYNAAVGTGAQFLVTGGTGFIGRFVVRNLLHNGASVRLLCRDEDKARRLFGERIEIVAGNLLDSASCQRACRDVQTIIHLGGSYRFGRRHRFELEAANQCGSENILQAAADRGVARFVHVSSSSVLGSRNGSITERDFPGRVSRRQYYRRSKWFGECAALVWAQRGLPVVIVNPTAPLGPDDETPTPTGQMVLDFLEGRFPFSARTTLNILHVAELAEGILAVAARGHDGERYLLGHHDLSLDEFLRVLAQCSGQSAPRFCLPWGVIALAGACGEIAGASRVCWETAAHARKRAFYSCQKAADELGWRPTRPLELTVRESVAWFRERIAAPALPANDLSMKTDVATS